MVVCYPSWGDVTTARWAITEWQGLTNRDGTGVLNEVVDLAFSHAGVRVEREYMPWKRALYQVATGGADMAGGLEVSTEYYQATLPVSLIEESVLYRLGEIPTWKGAKSLAGKIGVWPLGYLEEVPITVKNFMKGQGIQDRQRAIDMVLIGRADYYFDNKMQLEQAFAATQQTYNPERFTIQTVHVIELYMSFTKNKNGKKLRELYDIGIQKALKNGELNKVYKKWKQKRPF